MKYAVKFPTASLEDVFYKTLLKIPKGQQDKLIDKVVALADNPYPYGKNIFKKLTPPIKLTDYTAQYRLRIGDWRVIYDVDEKKKIVWIFALRRRSKSTYK